MPNRLFCLLISAAVAALAQPGPPPSTPVTYFVGRDGASTYAPVVAAGPGGDIWLGGETNGNTLPVVNAFQEEYIPGICGRFRPCSDTFLSRLRADGQGAVFSTYLGGESGETLADIAVDSQGNAYLVGGTNSRSFPFTPPLPDDAPYTHRPFVVKIGPTGQIVHAMALPGALNPAAVAVDGQGSVYVGGTSYGAVEQVGGLGLEPGDSDLLGSEDGGQSWEFRNRGLTDGGFAFEGTQLAATRFGDGVRLYALGGASLHRSDDRGEAWTPLEPPKHAGDYAYFNDLSVSSTQSHRVYVVYGCGLYGSSDGGEAWDRLLAFESGDRCVLRVALAAGQPGTVYAGGHDNQGSLGLFAWLQRSDDGGKTWSDVPVPAAEKPSSMQDLAVDPTDPGIVYASFATDGGFLLFRTDNAGGNWHRIFEGSVSAPLIDPAEPSTLFLGTQYFYQEGRLVYRSFDRGETWMSSVLPAPTGSEGGWVLNLALGVDALYVTTNEGFLFVSTDRGQNWSQAPGPPVPVYHVAADPVRPATVYVLGTSHQEQGFLMKLDPDASRTEYLTLLGGSGDDRIEDLAVDEEGRVYVTGTTASPDFPVTTQLTSSRPGFDIDAFLAVISPGGERLEFATWIGGSGYETTPRLALRKDRTVVLAGSTGSRDFPLENPIVEQPARSQSHWVAAVKPEQNGFAFAGYLGPNDAYSSPPALAADLEGSTYIGGVATRIGDDGFTTTSEFLMRLDAAGNLTHLDPIAVSAIAVRSPGSVVTANVGSSGILDRPWRANEAPAISVSVRDYNASGTEAPHLGAIVNAADELGHPLTPGTVVSIYGVNLGPAEAVAAQPVNRRYPSEVAGVRVLFGDRPAPLLYVSQGQINTVTPADLDEHPLVPVRVERDGVLSNVLTLTTDSVGPAIFSMDSGVERAALAVNSDGTINSPGNPAAPGSMVSIFTTGAGGFSPPLADGEVAPLEPPFPTAPGITGVLFPFQQARISYAGAAPGVIAGVAQVNFVVPAEAMAGDSYLYIETDQGKTSTWVRLSVGP